MYVSFAITKEVDADVLTLRRWLGNLHADRAAMAADAGEERTRVWELYMTGSALAFEDGDVSVFRVLAARPGAPHGLPLLREAAFGDAEDADRVVDRVEG